MEKWVHGKKKPIAMLELKIRHKSYKQWVCPPQKSCMVQTKYFHLSEKTFDKILLSKPTIKRHPKIHKIQIKYLVELSIWYELHSPRKESNNKHIKMFLELGMNRFFFLFVFHYHGGCFFFLLICCCFSSCPVQYRFVMKGLVQQGSVMRPVESPLPEILT